MSDFFTTGQAAKLLGVPLWKLLYVIRRGRVPEPRRVGHYRFFTSADLPRLRNALVQAGYLDREEVTA